MVHTAMFAITRFSCWLLVGIATTALTLVTAMAAAPDVNTLKILDGTVYKNRPDMRNFGIGNITILYESRFWDKGENRDNIPSTERIRKLARDHDGKTEMIVIDIEHWKVEGHPLRPWIANNSIDKYIETYRIFKQSITWSRVGYFVGSDNIKMARLAGIVDVAFPSAYTFSEDPALWEKSLLAKLEQIRNIYSGEVYVFLWPQYHDHAPAPEHLRLKYLPAKFWRRQLEFASQHVDGIVIWGGWDFENNRMLEWENDFEWWKETLDFMKSKNLGP